MIIITGGFATAKNRVYQNNLQEMWTHVVYNTSGRAHPKRSTP